MSSSHGPTVKAVKFVLGPALEEDGVSSSYLISGGDDYCLKVWALHERDTNGICLQTV